MNTDVNTDVTCTDVTMNTDCKSQVLKHLQNNRLIPL